MRFRIVYLIVALLVIGYLMYDALVDDNAYSCLGAVKAEYFSSPEYVVQRESANLRVGFTVWAVGYRAAANEILVRQTDNGSSVLVSLPASQVWLQNCEVSKLFAY